MMRIATESDLPEIVKIYNHAVDQKFSTADIEYTTVESRKDWLKNHPADSYPVFVLEDDRKIIAWCSLSPYRPGRGALRTVAEISYYVHKDYRRIGAANKLVAYSIEQSRLLGFENLIAILLDVNKASITLLEKYGFEVWGTLPDVANFNGERCGQFIYGRKV